MQQRYLQPPVDALGVVVMETRQHPQLIAISIITETDLTPVNKFKNHICANIKHGGPLQTRC